MNQYLTNLCRLDQDLISHEAHGQMFWVYPHQIDVGNSRCLGILRYYRKQLGCSNLIHEWHHFEADASRSTIL